MPLGLQTANLNFETIQEIGRQGRNSEVYIAHDKQLNGNLVVKKIAKTRIPNAADYYKEAKILYSSSHHNIVKVNYGCSDADSIYIAMPYYQRGSLKTLIENRFLTVREVVRYGIQFLSGLNHIHSKGMMHFDIKPDNVLISDSNEALLADFGLAKAMDNFGFAQQSLVYQKQIPPERFNQQDFTIQYDIYLSGLTLYRIVNGNQHYLSQLGTFTSMQQYQHSILQGTFPNRDNYLFHVPLKLRRVINKAMSVHPGDRHKNVLELINELSDIEENLDWQYSNTGGSQQWVNSFSDKTITILLTQNGNNFDLNSSKHMNASGNVTRIVDHCVDGLTSNNVTSRIQRALREYQ